MKGVCSAFWIFAAPTAWHPSRRRALEAQWRIRPPPARDRIRFPDHAAQPRGHLPDHAIAVAVTKRVVDFLETVQVQNQDCQCDLSRDAT